MQPKRSTLSTLKVGRARAARFAFAIARQTVLGILFQILIVIGTVVDTLVGRFRVVVDTAFTLSTQQGSVLVAAVALFVTPATHRLALERMVLQVARHQVPEVVTGAIELFAENTLDDSVGRIVVHQGTRASNTSIVGYEPTWPSTAKAALVTRQTVLIILRVVSNRTLIDTLRLVLWPARWYHQVFALDAVVFARSTAVQTLGVTEFALSRRLVVQVDVGAVDEGAIAAALHTSVVQLELLAELTRPRAGGPAAGTRRIAHQARLLTRHTRRLVLTDGQRVRLAHDRLPVDGVQQTQLICLEVHVAFLNSLELVQVESAQRLAEYDHGEATVDQIGGSHYLKISQERQALDFVGLYANKAVDDTQRAQDL